MQKLALMAPIAIALSAGQAIAQDTSRTDARYCGLGVQGSLSDFEQLNPNLAKIFKTDVARTAINTKLFDRTKAITQTLNLKSKADGTAALGLSHVLTSETIEAPRFVDPRDGKVSYAVSYSFGINTVLFDTNSRQIRAIIPAIVIYNEVRPTAPDANAKALAFQTIFNGIGVPETAMERWVETMQRLQIRADDKTYFQVSPIGLSDEARAQLEGYGKMPGQKPALFVKKLTEQYEALVAANFAKPIVPVAMNADGSVASGNQYVASIPDCLGGTGSFTLPDPTYKVRLTVEKLANAAFQHQLPGSGSTGSATPYQTEFAYGARLKTELLEFDSLTGEKPIDARTLQFKRSVRFAGAREVSDYEQFTKLTTNFMGELLQTYANPQKDWIKEHISASVTDKKQRDASKIAKEWKALVQGTMQIRPVAQSDGDDDE